MSIKQKELLNKVLSCKGSISEKTSNVKQLDNDHLQIAVLHSNYAKIEWEKRLYEKKWYDKPLGRTFSHTLSAVIGFLVHYLLGLIF